MIRQKSILRNATLNVVKTGATLLFPLISYMYVTRVFGVEGYGRLSFVKSIITAFVQLAMLEVSTYAIREAAKIRDNRINLSKFVIEMILLNAITMIVSYICLAFVVLKVPKLLTYEDLIIIYSTEILFQVISMVILVTPGQHSCNIRTRFLNYPDRIPITPGQGS